MATAWVPYIPVLNRAATRIFSRRAALWLPADMAPYTLLAVLGGGSFATVVVVRTADGTTRALKVLHRSRCADPTSVGRFRDEARILQAIRHPAVVHAHAIHRYGDRLVMELDFVDGVSLDQVLGPAPHRLPLWDALAIMQSVAEALWSAWADPWGKDGQAMEIVHRDVHPANIMLDRNGHVRVLDFGNAKGRFDGREAMSLYDLGGAIGYLAPERKEGHAGPPVDVYALAALFVHMLGDRLLLPQRAARHDEVAATVIGRLGLEEKARSLAPLLLDMLRFESAERPSMGEVVERLTALRAGLPQGDLLALAQERVAPVLTELPNPHLNPRDHRRYDDVSFLETETPDAPLGRLTVPDARRRLRAMLAQPDWTRRVDEVKRISRASEPPTETPLLDVLARARNSWWRPLARKVSASEAEAALLILGERPSLATLEAAGHLCDHDDERIRTAAQFVVARADAASEH